jgi:hypothetical protein
MPWTSARLSLLLAITLTFDEEVLENGGIPSHNLCVAHEVLPVREGDCGQREKYRMVHGTPTGSQSDISLTQSQLSDATYTTLFYT